jgi:glucose-6-phosphate 1-dehydrogenase
MNVPHSDALVFFGATGDLAYKKIFPSTFLAAKFSQEQRHLRRLGKVASLEKQKE